MSGSIGRTSRERLPRLRAIGADESGAFTIMALFVIFIILACFGFAVDYMRAEAARTRLQGTIDQSVLAAASRFGSLDPETGKPRSPEEIARSYFETSGFDGEMPTFTSSGDCNDSYVQAEALLQVPTTYLGIDFLTPGYDAFPAPANGRASESTPRIEVSLVLDVSGSMGSNGRIENLRPAAKEFVSMMLETTCEKPNVYISVIPFATQVSAGADLLSRLNVSDEHAYSNCVDFGGASFNDLAIKPRVLPGGGTPLARTSHFDPFMGSGNSPVIMVDPAWEEAHDTYWVCHPKAARDILPWSIDERAIGRFIDDMPVGGNTSMDVGAKWGLALLDPAMRGVVNDYIDAGDVDAYYAGRPLAYSGNPADVIKVLVLMTDGENTAQYYLAEKYREGPSSVWVDDSEPEERRYSTYMGQYYVDRSSWSPGSGWDRDVYTADKLKRWTPGNSRRIKEEDTFPVFFHHELTNTPGNKNAWRPEPDGAGRSYDFEAARFAPGSPVEERLDDFSVAELSWPELFRNVHVQHWSDKIRYEAQGDGRWNGWSDAVRSVDPAEKDSRLHTICQKARAEGVQVFTISFEAPRAGRTALLDCANDGNSTSRYFDVKGKEIRDAFASIVEQLNLLRLVR